MLYMDLLEAFFMGIAKKNYELLKKEFGLFSSWAIWDRPTLGKKQTSKDNVGSMNWKKIEGNLIKRIRTRFVFVAFNGSSLHDEKTGHQRGELWANFHSNYSHGRDNKLRYAIAGSSLEGSYITDLVKNQQSPKAKDVARELKKNGALLKKHVEILKKELKILCEKKKPCLIALGRDTEFFLRKTLEKEGYTIRYLTHYSNTSPSFEMYKKDLEKIIQEETSM